ncbi:helix-turn-helix domain-containing protein [Crocosphaera sp.]|uniref:helix-turn-helix domain-containing protein n=1 Tax=Crocosphaera sp. TaxID=2729996 RepID=UPI003F240BCE|nr:transcriptional regulator [Crocosphaera sp.]
MTLILNPKSYGKLLAKYQPKVIKTEDENEQVIALANELEHQANRTIEEETLLELLIVLIERFEEQNYPIPQSTPNSMLKHLMECNNYKPEDLIEVIGSRKKVLELMEGKDSFSQLQSQKLADLFNVDVDFFVNE